MFMNVYKRLPISEMKDLGTLPICSADWWGFLGNPGKPVAPVFADGTDELHVNRQSRFWGTVPVCSRNSPCKVLMLFGPVSRQPIKLVWPKCNSIVDNPAPAVPFHRRLRVFDPCSIRGTDAPWSSGSGLLGLELSPDDGDDVKHQQEKGNALLASEWQRYTCLERHAVHHHRTVETFWQARGSMMYDAVAIYIFVERGTPITSQPASQPYHHSCRPKILRAPCVACCMWGVHTKYLHLKQKEFFALWLPAIRVGPPGISKRNCVQTEHLAHEHHLRASYGFPASGQTSASASNPQLPCWRLLHLRRLLHLTVTFEL